ncbi:MAG: hypothetical protein KF819_21745 [Labilithrix sp.]|nr:hypothetical protein [Labilithrix sp.]
MGRGVSCHRCGASTPMPDDLRVPVFACAFCRAELATASYAGAAAVSADALIGHLGQAMDGTVPVAQAAVTAPRFEGGSTDARAANCQHCAAPIAVPLDLQVRELTCTGCGRVQAVNRYVSDDERFALDMQRQVAGNEAFKRLCADGVPCSRCGAKNAVPEDGSVQLPCTFCKATILLSDHVDASAIARARLKHGVFALRDAAIQQQTSRDRRTTTIIVGCVVGGIVVSLILGLVLSTR